jgi:hypothetical protein
LSDTPVIGSDLFTTICDVVKAPLPTDRTIDGASLLPLFAQQAIVRQQPLYWRNHLAPEAYRVALRVGDWKIVGADDLSQFELYNLRDDWQETQDLSHTYPDKFAELKAQLIAHDAAVLKEGPDWWKDEVRNPPRNQRRNAVAPPPAAAPPAAPPSLLYISRLLFSCSRAWSKRSPTLANVMHSLHSKAYGLRTWFIIA